MPIFLLFQCWTFNFFSVLIYSSCVLIYLNTYLKCTVFQALLFLIARIEQVNKADPALVGLTVQLCPCSCVSVFVFGWFLGSHCSLVSIVCVVSLLHLSLLIQATSSPREEPASMKGTL